MWNGLKILVVICDFLRILEALQIFFTIFLLKSDSQKTYIIYFIESPLKMMKNALSTLFLFHLKSSFRPQDI